MHFTNRKTNVGLAMAGVTGLLIGGCGVTGEDSGTPTAGEEAAPYYEGETVTIIVPFDAGGASDTFSRLVATCLSEHIEGSPEVVVENVPGGAQKNGLNQFERADHDGLTLAMGSGGLITASQFETEGIQFDLADYETLMAFGGTIVIFGSTEAGISSLEDLTATPDPVFYGGLEFNASEAVRVFALEEMGINLDPLMGYDGGGSVTAAVLRGELDIGNSTATHFIESVQPLVEDGSVAMLMTQGKLEDGEVVRSTAFPDTPTMPEAYTMLTGQEPEGIGWETYDAVTTAQTNLLRTYWVHGDAPEEARVALREGVAECATDPEFTAEAKEVLAVYEPPLIGEEVQEAMSVVTELSQENVTWLEEYMAENVR